MKVKVGGTFFDSSVTPVMVVLSQEDKDNISNMSPEASRYASFPDDFGTSFDMVEWMNKGFKQ